MKFRGKKTKLMAAVTREKSMPDPKAPASEGGRHTDPPCDQDLRVNARLSVMVLPWSSKVQTWLRWFLSGMETLSETM